MLTCNYYLPISRVISFILISFLFVFSPAVYAQNQPIKIRKAGNEAGGYDNPKEAALFEFEKTKDPATGKVPREKLWGAIEFTRSSRVETQNRINARSVAALSWIERGPNADVVGPSNGNTRAGNGLTAGRVRAIWVDITDATGNTVWVGGVDGGLWKTTNISSASPNWILINDYLANLAITSICQDPTNPSTMYFSTGEAFSNADAVRGIGVFKSTNSGVSWSLLPSTTNYTYNSKILCDASGNVYLATVGNGFLRTINGGTSWTVITPTGLSNRIADFEISSTGRLHISCGLGTSTNGYRFTDIPVTVTAGTWTSATTAFAFPSGTSSRLEMACLGNVLYALPSNTSAKVTSVFKSVNGGVDWTTIALTATNITDFNGGSATGQAWYCLAIDIDPSNTNNVIIGNLNTLKTTDGAVTWAKSSEWVGTTGQYVHADQQIIKWYDNGNKLLIGSDGGIHFSTNKGTTITDRNIGLRIKQFYACAIHPTQTNYFLAGAQDNGTHQLNTAGMGSSVEVTGGDGAYCDIDQDQPQYQYGAYVYNTYRRSSNSGTSWSSINFYKGSNTVSSNFGSFINPRDYDNANNIFYAAADAGEFFRWTTAQTTSSGNYYVSGTPVFPTGATIVSSVTVFSGSKVSAVFVSPFTNNRVYFGTAGGRVIRMDNAHTATGASGINISGAGLPAGTISCINTGTDDQNLIVSFSNYGVSSVWVTANGGTSWTAIEGNLPDMPVRSCMFYPNDNTKAFIATETGVWETDLINGGSTIWTANPSFPVVRTDMLQYRALDGTLIAATHGRGLFSTVIPVCANPPIVTVSPTASQICNPGGSAVSLSASGAVSYTWSPGTGLSATTGSSVTANPAVTTTYTVTGDDGTGCTGFATTTITVAYKPVVNATATPATICSGENAVLNANASSQASSYCATLYSNGTGFGDYITLVQIPSTTLNNVSGASASPYYILYPASGSTTASLTGNVNYNMTVSGGTYSICYIRGWIDYNKDGEFDATESIGISPNVGSSASGNISFTIPLSALNGVTRMRLRSSDTAPGPGTSDFCGSTNSGYGETEDYSITITGAAEQFTYSWSPATYLASSIVNPATAVAMAASQTYTVLVTAPGGCTESDNVTVTVNNCFTTLNLKVFLEGFYSDINTMRATKYDLGLSVDPAVTDDITVDLWSPASLSNPSPNYSVTGLLRTNGNATLQYPSMVSGNSFYIAVKHRNHIETWSKNPVAFTTTTVYDFTSGLIKAYGDGVNPPMAAVAGSLFANYGGDVNQDGSIDASDMGYVDNDNSIFAFGYNDSDATGDGATDASDLSVVDNNSQLFLFYARPF